MAELSANLAALIGSRICHDLISPIGAITNRLELIEIAGNMQGPELDLISHSVTNASARIRFFRIAYGAAGDQMLGRSEILSILDDMNRAGRIEVNWVPASEQPRAEVRLAFLAIQCCETAMPYGGTIRVETGDGLWEVSAMADKTSIEPDLWARLENPGDTNGLSPSNVQFGLLPVLAAELGRRVSVADDGSLTLRF
jgi:histidine phosphotransferase ChpT